jgi:mRNA interferase MazF
MKRGDMYLLRRPGGGDPKKQLVVIVVSRQALVDSRFPTVVCAPGSHVVTDSKRRSP